VDIIGESVVPHAGPLAVWPGTVPPDGEGEALAHRQADLLGDIAGPDRRSLGIQEDADGPFVALGQAPDVSDHSTNPLRFGVASC
jgi:hypothetical protein